MAKQTVKKTVTKITIRPNPELVAQKQASEVIKDQKKSLQAQRQKRAPNGRFA